jgi:hypothetical protein
MIPSAIWNRIQPFITTVSIQGTQSYASHLILCVWLVHVFILFAVCLHCLSSVFEIVTSMSEHPNLLRLFEPLPGDNGRSLAHLLGELRKSAQIASKFEKMAEKAGGSGSLTTAADSTDAAAHASKRSRVTGVPIVDQHPKTIVAHIVSQNKCSLYLVRLPAVRARQLRLLTSSLRVLCLFLPSLLSARHVRCSRQEARSLSQPDLSRYGCQRRQRFGGCGCQ